MGNECNDDLDTKSAKSEASSSGTIYSFLDTISRKEKVGAFINVFFISIKYYVIFIYF